MVLSVSWILYIAFTQGLKIVRIVYDAQLDFTRSPRKCRVATDTKHLVAPLCLENAHVAFGARFGASIQLCNCRDLVGVTHVCWRDR